MMIGIDTYGVTKASVGIDFLNFASGALKSAGGATGSLGKPTTPTVDDAAKKAAADKKAAASQGMSTWTKAGIGLVVVVVGIFGWRHFHHKK